MTTRKKRVAVDLPTELGAAVSACADARGDVVAHLWVHWTLVAARMAEEGLGHLLPQQRRLRRTTPPIDMTPVFWTQGREEYLRRKALIEGAGSSVPAVLREAAEAYVAAGGDAVAMRWPPKSAAQTAA